MFQFVIADLCLIVVHSKQYVHNIFVYGIYTTRIDFIYMKEYQIRLQKLKIHIHYQFKKNQDVHGSPYRSLIISLPR